MLVKINKLLKHLVFLKSPVLVKRILNGYFKTMILRQDTLRSIELAITYLCQAKCHKCYSSNLQDTQKEVLTLEKIKDIINQAMSLGIIHVNITGGGTTGFHSKVIHIMMSCIGVFH